MIEIKGRTLITTDWHFGLKNNSISRLGILTKVTGKVAKLIEDEHVDNLIFMGDFIHSRDKVSVQTMNFAYRCLEKLAKNVNFYFILGNHDIYMKNSNNITSTFLFKDIKNVHIVSDQCDVTINGKKAIFCPWLYRLEDIKDGSYDFAFGHFDTSPDYLMATYIEDHMGRNETDENLMKAISSDALLRESGFDDLGFETKNDVDEFINHKKSSELIGSCVNIVKKGGTVFSGHIHNRREIVSNRRNFIFVGSPYQQTRGEIDSIDGVYVMDEKCKYRFVELEGIPKHVELRMSEILKVYDTFDFSIVTNNIIHKIYDVEVDMSKDSEISRRISDNHPYEELPSDYDVPLSSDIGSVNIDNESIDSIRKGTLEYLFNFINNTENKMIDERKLNKETLFEMIKEYHDIVEGVV